MGIKRADTNCSYIKTFTFHILMTGNNKDVEKN